MSLEIYHSLEWHHFLICAHGVFDLWVTIIIETAVLLFIETYTWAGEGEFRWMIQYIGKHTASPYFKRRFSWIETHEKAIITQNDMWLLPTSNLKIEIQWIYWVCHRVLLQVVPQYQFPDNADAGTVLLSSKLVTNLPY